MTTRYTIVCHDKPGSKPRYRHALRLLGAEGVKISELQVEASAPKPKPDNLPTSPEAKAVASLFGRPLDKPWSDAEIALFRKTKVLLTETNMKLLTTYYTEERKRGREGIQRRDLTTFLRNLTGEIDRASAVKPRNGHALEWTDSTPKLTVLPDPVETARLAAQAREGLAKFREGLA